MRFGPLVLTLLVAVWLFLALLAWSFVGLRVRGGPRMRWLPVAMVAAVAVAMSPPMLGYRGSGALLASFPLAFVAGVLVCSALGVRPRLRVRRKPA